MADIFSIISSNYLTVGSANYYSPGAYTAVDPDTFQGTWSGAYADNTKFSVTVSNVDGFRAKVKYQSGSTIQYQDVLIKNNSFRVGDSKFTVTAAGTAQINTVKTDPVTGSTSMETAYATQG